MKKVSPLLKVSEHPFFNLVFELFQQMPLDLRELVCGECDWSVPTYYRKLRTGKISNAELEKICKIVVAILNSSIEKVEKTDIGKAVFKLGRVLNAI